MSDDIVRILMQKIDRIAEDVAAIKARYEEKEKREEEQKKQQEKINIKVDYLERTIEQGLGAKGIIAWLITTGIAVITCIKEFWK